MPINLISKIKPKNNGEFPVFEDRDIVGGYQVRSNLTDRNSIPLLNRKEGMLVYTQSDSKYYTLNGGLTDGYWAEVIFGGSSQDFTLVTTSIDYKITSTNNEFIAVEIFTKSPLTITLPSNPIDGQEIMIKDVNGYCDPFYERAIRLIKSTSEVFYTLTDNYTCLHVKYNSTLNVWYIINLWHPLFFNKYSLLFDGTNKVVSMGNILSFENTDSFSLSCWFKADPLANEQYLICNQISSGNYRGYGIGISSNATNNAIDILIRSTLTNMIHVRSTTENLADNIWHYIAMTYNGSKLASGVNIYLNGLLETPIVIEDELTTSIVDIGSFTLGGRNDGADACFIGNIDEVSVYNKELSLAEVQAIYNSGVPINIKNLSSASNMIGYWRCGDEDLYPTIQDHSSDYQFPTIPDKTSNEYHGTAVNMEVSGIQFESPGSQALVFGGTDEYVNCGNVLSYEYNQPFSFGFWIKTTTINNYIFGKMEGSGNYRGYGCSILDNGKLHFSLTSVDSTEVKIDVDSTTSINNGKWNYIAITYDGYGIAAGIHIYINNVLDVPIINFDGLASESITNAIDFNIGGRANGSDVLVGSFSDFSVWNKELSSTEVAEIYNNKIPINLTTTSCAANLAAWWRCGENYSLAANGVPDFSGNELHGTQVNMEITDVESRTYIGNSMIFDDSNEFIKMGNVLNFNNNLGEAFSLSCWMKTTDNNGYLISKMSAYPIGYGSLIDSNGRPAIPLVNGASRIDVRTTSLSVNNGNWHYIVITYDGSQSANGVTIYVNATTPALTRSTNSLGTKSTVNSSEFNINGRTNGTFLINANIYDPAVFNKALSLEEVITFYNKGIPIDLTDSANLVGYWKMGNGVGFNGIMTNMGEENIVADVP